MTGHAESADRVFCRGPPSRLPSPAERQLFVGPRAGRWRLETNGTSFAPPGRTGSRHSGSQVVGGALSRQRLDAERRRRQPARREPGPSWGPRASSARSREHSVLRTGSGILGAARSTWSAPRSKRERSCPTTTRPETPMLFSRSRKRAGFSRERRSRVSGERAQGACCGVQRTGARGTGPAECVTRSSRFVMVVWQSRNGVVPDPGEPPKVVVNAGTLWR